MRYFLLLLALLGLGLQDAGASQVEISPRLRLSKQVSLIDEEIQLVVEGLVSGEQITLKAEALDGRRQRWCSEAVFTADVRGIVDLSKQTPTRADFLKYWLYSAADPMCLIWTLRPVSGDPIPYQIPFEGMQVRFSVERRGEVVARASCLRLKRAPHVKRIAVTERGLVAALFLPESDKPLPCVVTLSGSSGGLGETRAQLLASHGFATLALGYFGEPGLPANLERIPLEYFEEALNWLKDRPEIDSSRIGLYGVSRGAELALILGATFPERIHAIVATVPSSVIVGALGNPEEPAWTFRGQPVGPQLKLSSEQPDPLQHSDPEHAFVSSLLFTQAMEDPSYKEASIPVEKIQASLLLIAGGNDKMWPSKEFVDQIYQRLKEKKHYIPCMRLYYPMAGHQISIPYQPGSSPLYFHPIGKFWCAMGGVPFADEWASRDSWKQLIQFFEKELKQP